MGYIAFPFCVPVFVSFTDDYGLPCVECALNQRWERVGILVMECRVMLAKSLVAMLTAAVAAPVIGVALFVIAQGL